MKLFGEKASKKKGKKQKDVSVYTPYDSDPSYHVMGDGTTESMGIQPDEQKTGKKGIVLLVFAIIAFILAGCAFAAVCFIKPPEVTVHENDKTIIDEENGDAVTIDPGQRISDYFTFLVCATDIDETRTDNMMVIGFDTKNHKVNVLNIPRDVMCDNGKTGANRKINAAYGSHQDIQNTMKEVKKVIGFTPDKYIVVNFDGIAQIVDTIGGIDYEVPFKMIYNDPVQDLNIYFEPGMQHMNGEQVVEFLRWRHNDPGYTDLQTEGYDGGDESRIQKQQEFLMYLAKQILKPENILKAKSIAEAVFNNVKTDLTMGELVWMANQAMQVDTANIQMFTLPGYPANSYAGSDAFLSFFFPNEEKTLELVNQYFNPYDKPITTLDVIESPPDGVRRPNTSSDEDESIYGGQEEASWDEEEPQKNTSQSGSSSEVPEQTDDTQNGQDTQPENTPENEDTTPPEDNSTSDSTGNNTDGENGNSSDTSDDTSGGGESSSTDDNSGSSTVTEPAAPEPTPDPTPAPAPETPVSDDPEA